MKILHVSQPTSAGVPVCVAALVSSQIERGWEPVVACPSWGDLARWITSAGAAHLDWPAAREPGPSVIAEAARLARLVGRARPDLVHLHSSKAGLAGRLAIRGRIPTVFQPHAWAFHAAGGPVRRAAILWERIATRWTDALICVSEDERAEGEAQGIRGRYTVIPNGVDLERLRPAGDDEKRSARAKLNLPVGPVAVCVGRLSRQKGQDVLVDAWRRVSSEVPDATLVLVGDGPDREVLERSDPGRVLFPGWSPDPSLWYAACDLIVVASRWEAGASLVVMEGLARARPVVATRVAGMAEALPEDALVPVDDVTSLADAILARLRDPRRAGDEGRRGRAIAEQRYDRRRTAAEVETLYERVLAARALA